MPKILVSSIIGDKPSSCNGKIEFKNVEFMYPNRTQTRVLKGVHFSVDKGETVALVGSSGCGKSTCMQLLERFYDVDGGQVVCFFLFQTP